MIASTDVCNINFMVYRYNALLGRFACTKWTKFLLDANCIKIMRFWRTRTMNSLTACMTRGFMRTRPFYNQHYEYNDCIGIRHDYHRRMIDACVEHYFVTSWSSVYVAFDRLITTLLRRSCRLNLAHLHINVRRSTRTARSPVDYDIRNLIAVLLIIL